LSHFIYCYYEDNPALKTSSSIPSGSPTVGGGSGMSPDDLLKGKSKKTTSKTQRPKKSDTKKPKKVNPPTQKKDCSIKGIPLLTNPLCELQNLFAPVPTLAPADAPTPKLGLGDLLAGIV